MYCKECKHCVPTKGASTKCDITNETLEDRSIWCEDFDAVELCLGCQEYTPGTCRLLKRFSEDIGLYNTYYQKPGTLRASPYIYRCNYYKPVRHPFSSIPSEVPEIIQEEKELYDRLKKAYPNLHKMADILNKESERSRYELWCALNSDDFRRAFRAKGNAVASHEDEVLVKHGDQFVVHRLRQEK